MPLNIPGILVPLQLLFNPRIALPNLAVKDIRHLDFVALKKAGYRGAVFDKDNCLTLPHKDELVPELKACEAWDDCRKTFGDANVLIVSNSAGTRSDPGGIQAESVKRNLRVPVLFHPTPKPGYSCIRAIQRYFASLQTPVRTEELVVVGDRIFTDVVMANRLRNGSRGFLQMCLKCGLEQGGTVEKERASNASQRSMEGGPLAVWTTGVWEREATFMRWCETKLVAFIQRRLPREEPQGFIKMLPPPPTPHQSWLRTATEAPSVHASPRRMSRQPPDPVSPLRTNSFRKLANNFLRPSRRAAPSLAKLDSDGPTPPSSPSLYSLSSEGESRSNLPDEAQTLSPTSSNFSMSASEGHGDAGPIRRPAALELVTAGLELDRSALNSPTRRPQRTSADFSWAMNTKRPRPQRIIIDNDNEDAFINSDAASVRAGGIWDVPMPLSPAEWLAPMRKGAVVVVQDEEAEVDVAPTPLSPVEGASSSESSPATPRFRPTSDMHGPARLDVKPVADVQDAHTPRIAEQPSGLVAGRRARSSSEPQRLFLASAGPAVASGQAGTVPSTPTHSRPGFIMPVSDLVPRSPPSIRGPSFAPSPAPSIASSRRSSMTVNNPSPTTPKPAEDASARRESRIYITPDAGAFTNRGHTHSNSEPTLPTPLSETDPASGSLRYATWNSYRKRNRAATTSAKPFDDATLNEAEEGTKAAGDSTPVLRKEQMWTGEWNRDNIQDVIHGLRSLR
ncbi:hypothetical protein MKEN_01419000 [Mycena kentingensis (nom. inval.)]|nr:hypothetical protein MKEN_01419000 [Mycena kentingensis (nom. inval.)]